MVFNEIVPMSVQKDPESVRQLALKIRHLLDTSNEMNELPVQQALDQVRQAEKHRQIQQALHEQQSSVLV